MAGQGFHHVAIRAIDFDATLKFYAEGLGCSVRLEFSVPGRIDRAAFLDMGVGTPTRNRPKGRCCTFASGSTMLRLPIPVRSLPARLRGSHLCPRRRWWVERWHSSRGRMAR